MERSAGVVDTKSQGRGITGELRCKYRRASNLFFRQLVEAEVTQKLPEPSVSNIPSSRMRGVGSIPTISGTPVARPPLRLFSPESHPAD